MGRNRRSILVKVRRAPNITDNFVTIYNDLPRGAGEWSGLSAEARILLISGLSCRDGWDEASMEDLEGWLPDLGRDRQEAVRRELRERGFMTLNRSRINAGPDAGMFEWVFEFHMHALPADKRDQLKAKAVRKPKVNSIPGESGNGEDQPDATGHSMPGNSGNGKPGNGGAGTGGQGASPYIEKEHLEKEQPPLPPASPAASGTAGAGAEGGDYSEQKPKPEATIATAVDWLFDFEAVRQLAAKYSNWSREAVADALAKAVADGRGDLRMCAKVLLGLAKEGQTRSARRLLESGPWWTVEKPFIPAPAPAESGPRCQKPGHVGPLDGCIPCRGEAKAALSAAAEGAVDPQRAQDAEAAFRAGLAPGVSRARAAMQVARPSAREDNRVAA